jgi:hypothetical protein
MSPTCLWHVCWQDIFWRFRADISTMSVTMSVQCCLHLLVIFYWQVRDVSNWQLSHDLCRHVCQQTISAKTQPYITTHWRHWHDIQGALTERTKIKWLHTPYGFSTKSETITTSVALCQKILFSVILQWNQLQCDHIILAPLIMLTFAFTFTWCIANNCCNCNKF